MTKQPRDGALQRRWQGPAGISASLTHYPGAGVQHRHAHDHHQLSVALAGSLCERLESKEFEVLGMGRGVKPAGAAHADRWGPDGVLIFTLRLDGPAAQQLELVEEPGWKPIEAPAAVALCLNEIYLSDESVGDQLVIDLVSSLGTAPAPAASRPQWLTRVRRQIEEQPEKLLLSTAAREAGVSRVHLSRMFHSAYGLPPSVYRRQVLLARAMTALTRGNCGIAEVAAEAGFYDQAHFARALRRATGLSPRRARELLRDVTSVQDPQRTASYEPVQEFRCSHARLRQP